MCAPKPKETTLERVSDLMEYNFECSMCAVIELHEPTHSLSGFSDEIISLYSISMYGK